MSRRGLPKAFQKHLGRSPGEALEMVCMEQARKFIIESGCKLKDLPAVCGYRKVNTFYVAFKCVAGMSPGKFRKLNSF